MIFRAIATTTLLVALSGCSGGGGFNPLNLFGPKSDTQLVVLEPEEGWDYAGQDYRGPIQQVTRLAVERASGGVIIRAEGVPATLGYWDADLVAENNEQPDNGVMTYTFKVAPPVWQERQGTPYSRTITVAHYVSDVRLGDTRTIRVVGATNSLSSGRR
ncbi:hypothetical protein [Maritimibacter sp. DP1N21-5]|uniref:hypothetical protein n=1 Tax=Maritimibacter sp. DP1N21-5 TaxID=2836867 RepID=UPI001C484B4A|nr:hypothetical protein [Maritimibacter sp. DP1N21-5]MBV7409645.1 hypothetical protein [Maritimibacter sp. DP1N21-5]